jgi:hypothetical protein
MAQLSTGYTWQSGDTVTPALLNQTVNSATITSIANSDVANNAAIALSKLGTGTLPAGITAAAANIAADAIDNNKVALSAAIAHSKLASMTAGHVLLGNASNVATATALTGDVTVSNAGATTIGSAKVVPAMLSQPFTVASPQASTSGTNIDFTGIPSWAKRITVMFADVSLSGSDDFLVQLGDAGGVENTGYVSTSNNYNNAGASAGVSKTTGFAIRIGASGNSLSGHMSITKVSGNLWVSSHAARFSTTQVVLGGGSKTLDAELTQVRITTDGSNTFDAGTINISYEG